MGTCTCLNGYGGRECEPVDECETESPCPGGSRCSDEFPPERFKCACKHGFTAFLPNELPDEPLATLAYRPVACIDDDECANITHPVCHPMATCTNTIGSYECECIEGLVGNGISNCTEPQNETAPETATEESSGCSVGTDCQGSNMQCVNATCICRPGYAQVGPNCQNEVHCDPGGFNNDCHRRATCIEEEGFPGFSCNCTEGWKDAFEGANGRSCVDIQPVTEAPPEPVVETTTLPEGVGPHPNRPTVFQSEPKPQCVAPKGTCGKGSLPCCKGKCKFGMFRRRDLQPAITLNEANRVLQSSRGDPDGYFEVMDNIISEASIQALKEEVDDAYANDAFDSSKLPMWRRFNDNLPAEDQLNHQISGEKLVELIGKDEAALLLEFFHATFGENAPVTSINLQISHNEEMSWFSPHTDNEDTMIVFLGREDFESGGLGYYNKDGYTVVPAAKGRAVAHGAYTVHQSEAFKGWRHLIDMKTSGEGNDCILEKHLL